MPPAVGDAIAADPVDVTRWVTVAEAVGDTGDTVCKALPIAVGNAVKGPIADAVGDSVNQTVSPTLSATVSSIAWARG